MSSRCEYCDEPALETDAVCWHCGMPLPGRREMDLPAEQVEEDWRRTVSPPLAAVYVVMTIVVLLGAFLVMVYLGRLPLVQIGIGTRTAAQWEPIISADRDFILSLPESWTWYDGALKDQRILIDEKMVKEKPYHFGTYPFGAEVDDVVIRFVAEASPQPEHQVLPFLVVAQSNLLNRLTYEEARDFLLNSDYQVSQASFVNDFDKSHLSVFVRTELNEGQSLNCRQQFIRGISDAYIVSLCAPSSNYQTYTNTFEDILSSFQRLDS